MKAVFYSALTTIGLGFAIFFFVTIGPLFIANPNLIDAFKAGFVNPYSSGFATDAIACWLVLAVWVIYEKWQKDINHGWFDSGIDEAFAKDKTLRIVFKDSGFKNDTAKTNVKQLLKQLSPKTEMKVI